MNRLDQQLSFILEIDKLKTVIRQSGAMQYVRSREEREGYVTG